jgi:hypothetical protein
MFATTEPTKIVCANCRISRCKEWTVPEGFIFSMYDTERVDSDELSRRGLWQLTATAAACAPAVVVAKDAAHAVSQAQSIYISRHMLSRRMFARLASAASPSHVDELLGTMCAYLSSLVGAASSIVHYIRTSQDEPEAGSSCSLQRAALSIISAAAEGPKRVVTHEGISAATTKPPVMSVIEDAPLGSCLIATGLDRYCRSIEGYSAVCEAASARSIRLLVIMPCLEVLQANRRGCTRCSAASPVPVPSTLDSWLDRVFRRRYSGSDCIMFPVDITACCWNVSTPDSDRDPCHFRASLFRELTLHDNFLSLFRSGGVPALHVGQGPALASQLAVSSLRFRAD